MGQGIEITGPASGRRARSGRAALGRPRLRKVVVTAEEEGELGSEVPGVPRRQLWRSEEPAAPGAPVFPLAAHGSAPLPHGGVRGVAAQRGDGAAPPAHRALPATSQCL